MRALIAAGLAACLLTACATAPAPPAGARIAAAFDCARAEGATLISAHRGGPQPGLPENALETLQASAGAGVWLLEIDIRKTAEGALVLLHDETLDRTTNGAGPVAAAAAAEVARLRLKDAFGAPTPFAPPSLAAALAWADGRAVLQLDVKRGVALADVAAAVRRAQAEDRVVLIVYSTRDAVEARRVAPDMMISASIETDADLEALKQAGVDLRRVLAWTGAGRPDPGLWSRLRAAGVEPMFGAFGGADLEGREEAYRELSKNGLTVLGTDRPRQALSAVGAASAARGRRCFTGIIGSK